MTSELKMPDTNSPIIEAIDAAGDEVSKDGGFQRIGPFSLSLFMGEFVSVLGPGECVKMTFLRMIAGRARLTSGTIKRSATKPNLMREMFGFVFQRPALIEWRTVLQNVTLLLELRNIDPAKATDRARFLMAAMGLAGFENRYPNQISNEMGQRVSICRALLPSPTILLLDDPFRMLDALSRERIIADMQRIQMDEQIAVLMTTCDITSAVLLSDRVALMAGTPAQIQRTVPIGLPRPRRFDKCTSSQVLEYCNQIRATLCAQGVFL